MPILPEAGGATAGCGSEPLQRWGSSEVRRRRGQSELRAEHARKACLVEFRGLGANVGRIFGGRGVAWPEFGVAWPIGARIASREHEHEEFQPLGVNVGRISVPDFRAEGNRVELWEPPAGR
jgi:hypothetical protein